MTKCEALLQRDVCVTIVDVITERTGNLYRDLLDRYEATDAAVSGPIYAVTIRRRPNTVPWRLTAWAYPLTVGAELPTLPIWLSETAGVMLDLETTYEETCRTLRIV